MRAIKDLHVSSFPVSVQVVYVSKPLAGILRETNWGVISKMELEHIKICLGTDFRTFAITRKAIREFGIQTNTKLHEIWNLIYLFGYYLKPLDNPWNVALTITDLDNFTIEHETNPVLSLDMLVNLNPKILLFMDTRYKCNWPFNLNMNTMGFSFRAGLKFNIP